MKTIKILQHDWKVTEEEFEHLINYKNNIVNSMSNVDLLDNCFRLGYAQNIYNTIIGTLQIYILKDEILSRMGENLVFPDKARIPLEKIIFKMSDNNE